jgi:DNA-binding LacI/PurR family transcriptional regulator
MATKLNSVLRVATIRSIAQEAGVSPMTVSLALRNHPNAAKETRLRVQQIAERLGYRPDPTISKLMTHLSTQRSHRLRATMCCLSTHKHPEKDWYLKAVYEGARQRAGELGYSMDLLTVGENDLARAQRTERILRARSVQGLLLLPMASSGEFHGVENWERFSVVCSTMSVTSPVMHRVIPDVYENMVHLCRELGARGFRRLGLVITRAHDLRVGNRQTAAMAWHNRYNTSTPVDPLILDGQDDKLFTTWYRREKPDVLVVVNETMVSQLTPLLPASARSKQAFALTSMADLRAKTKYPHIDERPGQIGRRSTELLAGLIQHGDRGLPEIPHVTLIEGAYME